MILAFTVIDTGQGFDQNTAEQILLAMAQDDSTPLLKIPGVGVGMLIIKEISRHMHGEISFETFPEKVLPYGLLHPLNTVINLSMH